MNRYKKTNKILLVAVSVILLTSCEGWLELEPEDNVIQQEFWKSEQQVHSFTMGLYGKLLDEELSERLFYWSELRGDGLVLNNYITYNIYRIINSDITADNSIFKWDAFYSSINQCNILIKFAQNAVTEDVTFTVDELKKYEAEAYGLRALLYFYLVRSFGEVPLMLEAVVDDQVDLFIPKSSQEDLLAQIENDLDTARKYAVTDYDNELYNKGRLTRYGIDAIFADYYLWTDQYEECLEVCDEIIHSNRYGLVAGKDWLQEIFIDGNSNESIFELQFSVNKPNPFYSFFNESPGYFLASSYIMELYSGADVRGDSATWFGNAGVIYKYMALSPEEDIRRSSANYEANWIFYRYADVLLMKAEALNELGRGAEAIELVNRIQSRAGASLTSADATDDNEIREMIILERRKELAYEGKRWFDVLRNAKRDNYAYKSILIEMIESYAPGDLVNLVKSKYSDPLSHYFPIYYEELEVNYELIQNEYYLR
jgi:hypothetical protein